MSHQMAHSDSFVDDDNAKSSQHVLAAIAEAQKEFDTYIKYCDRVDDIVSASSHFASTVSFEFDDQEFDIFWASLEVIKPAVYAKPPQPVVSPRFQDRDKVATVASELIERCLASSLDRNDFDQVMLNIRDDLIISARGVARVLYESDEKGGGKRICDEHVDRCDFLHEPARKWSEVGWVAFGAYLTEREYNKRFKNAKQKPEFGTKTNGMTGQDANGIAKCKIWEVWHKADNRVYWVTEGVDTFLDEDEPFLTLEGFYPCPRPAYGITKRRSLIPVPDYVRYEAILEQINDTTRRIHGLLDWIRVRGLVPSGGDAGAAIERLLKETDDDAMLIPVPAALIGNGNTQFVQFLPILEFAQTIQGLIEARRELFQNYYELSGISDIMRGMTESEETLGAQRLKQQNGSARVRQKIDELQRVARDQMRIAAEIIAEKFDKDTLLEMSQMTIPSKKDVERDLKQLKESVENELKELEEQAEQAIAASQESGEEIDPQQAEQQFQQAQQQIIAKHEPRIKELQNTVVIEDVMALIKDQKSRAFTIDVETDSTIMTDEMAEKASRSEFLQAFATATTSVQPMLAAGESGAKLAGGMIKFALAPFRAGRELDGMIDDFIAAAPAALAQQQGGGDAEAQIAEANQKLAEAELQKAQAAIQKVQADTAKSQQELQLKAQEAGVKAQQDQERFQLEIEQTKGNLSETDARIQKIQADIELAFAKLGIEQHKEQREDVKTVAEIEGRQQDRAMQAQNAETDAAFRAHDAQRADRGQDFTERQGERQQSFAEKQAIQPKEGAE